MSANQNALTVLAQAAQVLVTALVVIEHDREKHVPGVKSGPQAETFLVPEGVADSLIGLGAVKRAAVIDTSSFLEAALSGPGEVIPERAAQTTTFADVADMAAADRLRAQLAEVIAERDNLAVALDDTQAQLNEAHSKLDAATLAAEQAGGGSSGDAASAAAADQAGAGTPAGDAATATAKAAATTAVPAAKKAAKSKA